MSPLKLIDTGVGTLALILSEDQTPSVDATIEALGHLPGGYFWEGVAKTLMRVRAPELREHIEFDSEAELFCVSGKCRQALEHLGQLMATLTSDPARLRRLMSEADPADFGAN